MNENQTQPVANAETQTKDASGSIKAPDKSEQQSLANSESIANQEQYQNTADKSVKENATAETPQEKTENILTTDKPVETATDDKTVGTDIKSDDQAKTDSQSTTNPADTTQPAQSKDDAAKPAIPTTKDDHSSKSADSSTDKSQTTDQEKSATENPVKNSNNPTAEPKKLSDVVPSTIVWLSGMVGKKQFDCAGPFSVPFVLEKPTWPYVTVAPNPKYTNQVFDYDADGGAGKWVPTDAKSQGQLLTDLAKQVTALKDDSQKHDQSADQSQKMGMQLTKVMMQLSSKVDALNTKIDGMINDEKDGDK